MKATKKMNQPAASQPTSSQPKKLSKAGEYMRSSNRDTWEILDMKAVLK